MVRIYRPPLKTDRSVRLRDWLALWPVVVGGLVGWFLYWGLGFLVCEGLIKGRLEIRWKPAPAMARPQAK
jgi:hypothetical protein